MSRSQWETLSASISVPAAPAATFAVLVDPRSHASIDDTGWVCEPVDDARLAEIGQVFRMVMHHADHPDGWYQTANEVRELQGSRRISWATGTEDSSGRLHFGGWVWRYDLRPAGRGSTLVRLTYDWSGATAQARAVQQFPPFGVEHLHSSLRNLAALVTAYSSASCGGVGRPRGGCQHLIVAERPAKRSARASA